MRALPTGRAGRSRTRHPSPVGPELERGGSEIPTYATGVNRAQNRPRTAGISRNYTTTAAREALLIDTAIARSASRVRSGRSESDDPGLYEATIRPWEIIASVLDKGAFRHRMRYLTTPLVRVYDEKVSLATRVQGFAPPDVLAVGFPLRRGDRTSYWDAPPREDRLPATAGGVEAVLDPQQHHLVALLDLGLLRRTLPAGQFAAMQRATATHALPVFPRAKGWLTAWLNGVLEATLRDPGLMARPATLRAFEEELPTRFSEALRVADPPRPRPPAFLRHRGFDKALEYLRATGASWVTVPELVEAAGVSQRTLQYAFREHLGMTPLGFLRLHRFHMARRELLMSEPGRCKVVDVAGQYGFFDLGRFAGEYRQLFGELPSVTLLASRPCEVGSPTPLGL